MKKIKRYQVSKKLKNHVFWPKSPLKTLTSIVFWKKWLLKTLTSMVIFREPLKSRFLGIPSCLGGTMRKVPRNRDGALCDHSNFRGYPSWIEQDFAQLSTVSGAFCREHLKILQKKLCKDRFRAIWVVSVAYLLLHRTVCPPVGLSVNRSGNSGHLPV